MVAAACRSQRLLAVGSFGPLAASHLERGDPADGPNNGGGVTLHAVRLLPQVVAWWRRVCEARRARPGVYHGSRRERAGVRVRPPGAPRFRGKNQREIIIAKDY